MGWVSTSFALNHPGVLGYQLLIIQNVNVPKLVGYIAVVYAYLVFVHGVNSFTFSSFLVRLRSLSTTVFVDLTP